MEAAAPHHPTPPTKNFTMAGFFSYRERQIQHQEQRITSAKQQQLFAPSRRS
jgi:hypothetical protein